MPLLSTPGDPELDEARNMLGFWMREAGAFGPVEGVRVFVTLGALWGIERDNAHDVETALAIFSRHRGKIEAAASRRFDDPSGRPEEKELHDGRPVVVVTTDDLANMPRASATSDPSRFERQP